MNNTNLMSHMKRATLFGFFAAVMCCMPPSARTADEKPAVKRAETDVLSGFHEKVDMLTAYFERLTAPKHPKFTSLEQWERRRVEVRSRILKDLGLDPMPERVPLKVRYGGSLDRGDYVIKRVYWQIWPKIYASGYLYLPKTGGKHPAIINPVGHWGSLNAKYAVVQSRCIGQVKRGYVALLIDPVHIDRFALLAGIGTLGYQTWTNIRGVDLVQTLPEVDPEKIGSTGASGGGMQTMHLMIADDRVKAGAPAVGIHFYRGISEPALYPHCACNPIPNILAYTDQSEMPSLVAPRPQIFFSVTGDWEKTFPTDEFPDIKAIYKLYGAEDKAICMQWDCGHNYIKPMREAAYAWFDRWLKDIEYPNAVIEPAHETETEETLKSLDSPPADAAQPNDVIEMYKKSFGFTSPQAATKKEWLEYQKGLRAKLTNMLGNVRAKGQLVAAPEQTGIAGIKAEKMLVRTEPEIKVPAILFRPNGGVRSPLLVVLHPKGKRALLENHRDLLQSLIAGKAAVFAPDVRLTGELTLADWQVKLWERDYQANWEWLGLMWGRPEPGQALTDLRACLDVLAQRDDLDMKRVTLIGLAESGSTALFAGALEPKFGAVVVETPGKPYREGRTAPLIAKILQVGDLPQVASAIAPRKLYIWSAGSGGFDFTQKVFAGLGVGNLAHLASEKAPVPALADAALKSIARR